MLIIDLGTLEYFDPDTNEFIYVEGGTAKFQYTLKILYDWEGKWKKPFLDDNVKLTSEEILDLYRRMAVEPIDDRFLNEKVMKQLSDYINDPMSATTFSSNQEGKTKKTNSRGKVYTSEELYALMIQAGVPLEFENRNLNRLLITLRIISNYNSPPKKMSRSDILRQNAKINASRRARLKTKG